MAEEIKWNKAADIILRYKQLEKNQGLKIYYRTIDFNTGKEHIIDQIIPYGFDYEYNNEVPILNPQGVMARYVNSLEFITWHVYDLEFTTCLKDIVKIEIIDNAIDEIMKQEGLL